MADTVTVNWSAFLKVIETLDLSADIPTSPARTHNVTSGVSGTLNASSTVPATKVWSDIRTVSGTSETLDLTALVRTPLANLDMSGLKLQCMLVKAATTNNAGGITIGGGASNGYEFLGGTNNMILLPGQVLMLYGNDKLPDVAAGAKTIDIGCTAADVYTIVLVFG